MWGFQEPEPATVNPRNLLVVNAARVHMPMRRFLSFLSPERSGIAASFYADGAGNLARYFPFLASDFAAPPMGSLLEQKRADLWIGGRSTSRMHYDNLDNLFSQVVGKKTFVLAPPDAGTPLISGRRNRSPNSIADAYSHDYSCPGSGLRLRKAVRKYDHPGIFSRSRGHVTDETVINYLSDDRPACMPTVTVTLMAGDMLYLPFGWWHEVHGEGDPQKGGLCASVTHFYHPYYCRIGGPTTTELGSMMINPRYRSLGLA